jgi:hypothetical protein
MKYPKGIRVRMLSLIILMGGCAGWSHGETVIFSGTFQSDDDEAAFTFSVANPETVTLDTTSYATGGFAPVLSLFGTLNQSDPALLAQDSGGVAGGAGNQGCGTRSVSPITGFCLDADIQAGTDGPIGPGTYLVVLTEDPNIALGPNLSDGFLYPPGSGNFTANGILPGPFVDPGGNQTTGAYSLTVSNVDNASQLSPTPEPSSAADLTAGLALLALGLSRRTRQDRGPKRNSIGEPEINQ